MLQKQMSSSHSKSPAPIPRTPENELFREKTRAPLRVPVRLQFDSFGSMREGFTANVSRSGMFVSCSDTKPVGTMLRFELELYTDKPPVTGLAEVVWLRLKQKDPDRPPGMGIQFRFLDFESQARVDRAVHQAIIEHDVLREPEASKNAMAQRAQRLRHEIENAYGRGIDVGSTPDKKS